MSLPPEEPQGVNRRRALLAGLGIGGIGVVGFTAATLLKVNTTSQPGTPSTPVSSGPGSPSAAATTSSSSTTASATTTSAMPTTSASAAASSSQAAKVATAKSGIVHPGLLHTQADFDRMTAQVKSGAQPVTAGWNRLTASRLSQSTWKANPQAIVYRGSGSPENYRTLYNDIHAAYQNALRWKITGDVAHGDAARDILNAWSGTLKSIQGTGDRFLAAGIYGYQFANVGELMRGYPGFDLARFQNMMMTVFYPMNNDFLVNHNNAFITNYWASWDQLTMASIFAIGVLCDDKAKIAQAVDYFKHGAGMGSITNSVWQLFPDGLGQWLEVGRDQGHATLGIGLTASLCEMAWNQGIDLYGYDNNRFMAGAEYCAKYNNNQDVPYTPFTWRAGSPGVWSRSQTLTAASPNSRGNVRPIWEMIYNHYAKRKGLSVPNIAALAAQFRPEGGGGDYGGNSGGFDQLGHGTLTFTR